MSQIKDNQTATVYVAMIADRHTDTEPYLFSRAEAAIDYARQCAHDR